jgi:hypothetical protein
MSKFFRKVASAFVVMDENAQQSGAAEGGDGAPSAGLDQITQETSSLLAQLEGQPGTEKTSAPYEGSLLDLTAEDVFRLSQVEDSPNSALRLVKLITGLSMFPREQQLTMVRAMDVADDTWSEAAVVQDAQKRQAILRKHLANVAAERAQRMDQLSATIAETKKNGDAVLAELDKRIGELYARREKEATATATEVAQLEQQQRELETAETRARQGTAQVIQALSGLLTFLGVPQNAEPR